MKELICKVKSHGRKQLQLKTQYPVPDKKRTRYSLDLYLYTPGQLNINEKSYGVSQFLKDYKSNIRYTSPHLTLAGLVDPECTLSPLYRINNKLLDLDKKARLDENYILYELRVLANIYRVELKSVTNIIIREMKRGRGLADVQKRINKYTREIELFLEELRDLTVEFMTPGVSETLRHGLSWADEFISRNTETSLLKLFDKTQNREIFYTEHMAVKRIIEGEILYRKEKGFSVLLDDTVSNPGQTASYRDSILKKWAQGAMYMNLEKTGAGDRLSHILSGIAAAGAMAFAVSATFFAERLFSDFSTPWILMAILTYTFKDRIKDVLKDLFFSFMPRFIADRMSHLIDPASGNRVGLCKTIVRFCTPSEVPENIMRLRQKRLNPFRSILPEENIIQCRKTININCEALSKYHKRHNSITEITRIRVDNWLKDMDDPESTLYTLKEGKKVKLKGSRVYHMNLIASLKEETGGEVKEKLFHYRLILNSLGIVDIESVDSN